MSANTIRIIVAIVLFGHGIGHTMGILTAAGMELSPSSSSTSWFTRMIGGFPGRVVAIALWTTVTLGFVASGLGMLGLLVPKSMWEILASISAGLSLLGLLLFWNAFAELPNKLGAIAVDLAVLASLIWLRWPAQLFLQDG